jgi:glycosyltransferase involved in cell wall biosynthesis
MPALEAALRGLIPIVSRDSALTEAVNGAAIPVDPTSIPEIGEAMESVLTFDDAKRKALRNGLMAHAQGATRERFIAEWNDLISTELQ